MLTNSFWKNKKVFITGHTGFRGSWLALTLQQAGAQVFGFALPPATSPNFFDISNVGQKINSTFADIRDAQSLQSALDFAQAEVVFHLAGGGGLKESWDRSPEVYSSQIMGTVHLLEALRETASVRAVVILSSDKVYRNMGTNEPFKEEDPLAGSAPAATAKACTELIVESYLHGVFSPQKYNKHKIAIATARIGAVIGGGDFSPESFIYQLAQACQNGVELPLKNPESVRSWLHVSDAIQGLALLGQALVEEGPKISGAWNFGAEEENTASVREAKEIFVSLFKQSQEKKNETTPQSGSSIHGTLNSKKAESILNWRPSKNYIQAISECIDWYKLFKQV